MEALKQRRVVCPNCGSYKIEHKWVSKLTKPQFKDVTFAELAEDLKDRKKSTIGFMEGDIHFPTLLDYKQLIVECKECGYTETFNIP